MGMVGSFLATVVFLTAPFVVLFTFGYVPVVVVGRLVTKRRLFRLADACAPVAGGSGAVIAYLLLFVSGADRFFVSEHVRTAWESRGLVYEMEGILLTGIVCALVIVLLERQSIRFANMQKVVTPIVAAVISFVIFCIWPMVCSPFV